MIERIRLYRAWADEGFCAPVFGSSYEGATLAIVDRVIGKTTAGPWSPKSLTWLRKSSHDVLPDLSSFPIGNTCSENAAGRLWPQGPKDLELLPVFVEGEAWYFMCCLRHMDNVVEESSDIEWVEYVDAGQIVRRVSDVRWITVCTAKTDGLDAFKLSISPWGWCYFTERFVERYRALGLKGVHFEHCGYIVDKPEDAVPPPPRPTPQVQQAPRWPKWETAPEEEVARFIQAGRAFLQARGLSESAEASAILSALAAEIDAHRPGFTKLRRKASNTLLEGLAGAFGLLLHRHLQWNWVDLQVTSRSSDLGLKSPNGSHALCLNQVMVRQLTASQPATIELLFNMIAAGNLPEGQAGDHVAIG